MVGDRLQQELIMKMGLDMGMNPAADKPNVPGVCLVGDGDRVEGYLWHYVHENHFAVSRCDFTFCRDVVATMPAGVRYISLRLDASRSTPPGRVVSFMEETGRSLQGRMKAGTHVSYTEVLYFPQFYEKHLAACFPNLNSDPVDILKSIGQACSWPLEVMEILTAIRDCNLSETGSELFMTAKAYELMSALLRMKNRAPTGEGDYQRILAVIRYIDEHYSEEILQRDLLPVANMSATKLKKLFRLFAGKSITEYIVEKRTAEVARLLGESDRSVEDIAGSVGYLTAAGFATAFKKQIGLSPTAYRRQQSFLCMVNPSADTMNATNPTMTFVSQDGTI